MATLNKFLIKWVVNGVVVVLFLVMFSDISIWSALVAATGLTVIAYVIGDQAILRSTNNTIATFADALLSFAYLYLAETFFRWGLSLGEILVMSVVLGIAEAVLHRQVFQEQAR